MNKHLGSKEHYQIQIGLALLLPPARLQSIGYSRSADYRKIVRVGGGAGYGAQFVCHGAARRAAHPPAARTVEAKIWQAVRCKQPISLRSAMRAFVGTLTAIKSRNLSTVTDDEVVLISDQLNTRPRKKT